MISSFRNKKTLFSFFLWTLFIGLFNGVFFLKQKGLELMLIEELLFLFFITIFGIVCFSYFTTNIEKLFHQKYPRIKASIYSCFSFVFFLAFGLGLVIVPLFLVKNNQSQKIAKSAEASKNTLIASGLKTGSTGEEVKILQSALATNKSIYPSGLVSSYYGDLTKQAVINFQEEYNLSTTGEVDQQTADKFNEVYGDKTKDYYLNKITNINSSSSSVGSLNQPIVNTNSDPIVTCLIHTDCGGGSRSLKQSDCNNTTCCQIGGKWYFYLNKSQCINDQNNYNNQSGRNNTFPTFVPLPTLAPFATWVPPPTFAPLPTFAPFPTTELYPTYHYVPPPVDPEQCKRDIINGGYDDTTIEVNCSVQFGDSSATEACIRAKKNERDQKIAACGS